MLVCALRVLRELFFFFLKRVVSYLSRKQCFTYLVRTCTSQLINCFHADFYRDLVRESETEAGLCAEMSDQVFVHLTILILQRLLSHCSLIFWTDVFRLKKTVWERFRVGDASSTSLRVRKAVIQSLSHLLCGVYYLLDEQKSRHVESVRPSKRIPTWFLSSGQEQFTRVLKAFAFHNDIVQAGRNLFLIIVGRVPIRKRSTHHIIYNHNSSNSTAKAWISSPVCYVCPLVNSL